MDGMDTKEEWNQAAPAKFRSWSVPFILPLRSA